MFPRRYERATGNYCFLVYNPYNPTDARNESNFIIKIGYSSDNIKKRIEHIVWHDLAYKTSRYFNRKQDIWLDIDSKFFVKIIYIWNNDLNDRKEKKFHSENKNLRVLVHKLGVDAPLPGSGQSSDSGKYREFYNPSRELLEKLKKYFPEPSYSDLNYKINQYGEQFYKGILISEPQEYFEISSSETDDDKSSDYDSEDYSEFEREHRSESEEETLNFAFSSLILNDE